MKDENPVFAGFFLFQFIEIPGFFLYCQINIYIKYVKFSDKTSFQATC